MSTKARVLAWMLDALSILHPKKRKGRKEVHFILCPKVHAFSSGANLNVVCTGSWGHCHQGQGLCVHIYFLKWS